jgi:hypothetical protein
MFYKFSLLLLSTSVAQKPNSTQPIKVDAEVAQTYSYDAEKYLKTMDSKMKKM